ncbi:hypothetical protein GWE18_18865 [Bradyrhizobium sp. CSA112]|uniref:hypothetical protein n=1 Tax=Bradyrhizobium sp. CSA112 TaxID=2699170 RepID=UPI0023B107DC|nr:hypothetical protein [Bradyrhizobium sp. CSA112]MDE5454869.1 hypothetical protein [Bradyrhizobium sp. CSA112]
MSIVNPTEASPASPADFKVLIKLTVRETLQQLDVAGDASTFINSKDCAAMLGISPEHLSAMRARNQGPAWSGYAKWIRYRRSDVIGWLTNLPKETRNDSRASSKGEGL